MIANTLGDDNNQVVNVVFDTDKTTYGKLLDVFWDAHDPTTKNRQGNDEGTQYSKFRDEVFIRYIYIFYVPSNVLMNGDVMFGGFAEQGR